MSINIESIIPMENGATVLRADLIREPGSSMVRGVVLAVTATFEFATWRVWRRDGQPAFTAESGAYFGKPNSTGIGDALTQATASYDHRRGIVGVVAAPGETARYA